MSAAGHGTFWARSAQKRQRGEFFGLVSNARFHRLPVGQISRNLHTIPGSVRWWILSEQNFANFPVSGFQKRQIWGQNLQRLATTGRDISEMITILQTAELTTNCPAYGMLTFHFWTTVWHVINLRKLNTGAQLQTFPSPTVSKSFLYCNQSRRVHWARSGLGPTFNPTGRAARSGQVRLSSRLLP